MGLSLCLICQVLPLPLSSIQIMQIKHFTDNLGLDLTNIYTGDLSKFSHTTHCIPLFIGLNIYKMEAILHYLDLIMKG